MTLDASERAADVAYMRKLARYYRWSRKVLMPTPEEDPFAWSMAAASLKSLRLAAQRMRHGSVSSKRAYDSAMICAWCFVGFVVVMVWSLIR